MDTPNELVMTEDVRSPPVPLSLPKAWPARCHRQPHWGGNWNQVQCAVH